jgi:polyribonucleotide nucleotidyltransferase
LIRSLVERTGCKIDIEDDGRVAIASVDETAAKKAVAIIEELTATAELNKTYLGKVVRVVDCGAFVEILPGTDGLLHVSEMAAHRVQDVRSEVKEGDQILVKVVNIDPSGKIRLSRKALIQETQGSDGGAPAAAEGGQEQRRHAGDRDRDRDRRGGHRGGGQHGGGRDQHRPR